MSEYQDYIYTFRMIVPDKSQKELKKVRDKVVEKSGDGSTPMVVSTIDDYMTVSLEENAEYPDIRLGYAMMMAKSALSECGIENPVFIWAYAVPKDSDKMVNIHVNAVKGTPNDKRVDLTDEMMYMELGKGK